MLHYLWLAPLGFVVGAFGTIIGAGGGFILAPILMLLYPHESPDTLTSISLAVVFINSLSGSIAYARQRRIDYHAGALFALAATPGAILGALTTKHLDRNSFDLIFGVLMLAMAFFLLFKPVKDDASDAGMAEGKTKQRAIKLRLGACLSIGIGYLSSLLGIGGGIIHVPVLVHVLGFPVHTATATSHFILMIMALAGSGVHLASGIYGQAAGRTIALALGVSIGAQVGARFSSRVRGQLILRGLAIALGFVGLRILLSAL
ncbi:MAG TPA: sulfite exporter TauE/SafE family protein [Armatimonadota bacterium]|nr:sulfite exporter TauE/SafE family protein [Armatimonadota bacterium]